MAIFARRILQQMLDENASFLSPEQALAHVNALNMKGTRLDQYLSFEWEVVVLNAFSRLGVVRHEEMFEGNSRPDIYFSDVNEESIISIVRSISSDASDELDALIAEQEDEEPDGGEFSFVADIATVSDEGLHDKNPVRAFQAELYRNFKNANVENGIYFRIGSYSPAESTDHRKKVKLPPKGQFQEKIFKTVEFRQFVRDVKTSPQMSHSAHFLSKDLDLLLRYDPNSFGGGGYPGFTQISQLDLDFSKFDPVENALKSNGVYRALKSKAEQLRKCNCKERRGVIVCDGGSQLMIDAGTMQTYRASDVVQKFLLRSTTIDFVILLSVVMELPWRANSRRRPIPLGSFSLTDRVPMVRTHLEFNPRLCETQSGMDFAKELAAVTLAMHTSLPSPVLNADNAFRWLAGPSGHEGMSRVGFSYSTGHKMVPTEVTFSARALLELLAGKVSLEEFLSRYGFGQDNESTGGRPSRKNPFESAYNAGRLISGSSLVSLEDADDDLVTFRFGQPNAAISPFKSPVEGGLEEKSDSTGMSPPED